MGVSFGLLRRRESNRALAMEKLKEGNVNAASELFQVWEFHILDVLSISFLFLVLDLIIISFFIKILLTEVYGICCTGQFLFLHP